MTAFNPNELVRLSQTAETVLDPGEDIRGRQIKDNDGNDLGKVHDLLIDQSENRVLAMVVTHGHLFEKTTSVIPVNAIKWITTDEVVVDHGKDKIAGSPAYDPELVYDDVYYAGVYDYYGYPAYWYDDYVYPVYPYYV
ncbi:PRC-barrel domain-containing protein [Galbitalea sp. SE-J8]|uniref:PRC-barrel domain-containing protein n=1 Tax=Galbitalea sp. SE-J8 TaxID=3054952 RepID=UPI00259CA7D3|nr:PRC-barrel domain-containing protein [Galbitalea sp. SE-J8]MDM4761983.1 PRC-barrel domain-containing protein [Galbitalea sp. SE-J8]